MKKIILLLLIFAVVLSASACSDGSHWRGEDGAALREEARIEQAIYELEQKKETSNHNTSDRSSPSVSSQTIDAPKDGLKSDGKIHVYIVGEGEKILTPESSFIRYITYYPESCHLIINMNGKDYAYSNFPSSLWKDFKNAESKGNFYNNYIKGVSAYLIKDYSSGDGDKIVVEYLSIEDITQTSKADAFSIEFEKALEESKTVFVVKGSALYHKLGCRVLIRETSNGLPLAKAEGLGFQPCPDCCG